MVRPVLSGQAGTDYVVRAGTFCSGRYYVVRPVLSGQVGTMWSNRYYPLVRAILCDRDS